MSICIAENLNILQNTVGKSSDQTRQSGFSELLFNLFDQQPEVSQEDEKDSDNADFDMAKMYASAYIAASGSAQIITDAPQDPVQDISSDISNDIAQITKSVKIDGLPPPAEAVTNGILNYSQQKETLNANQTNEIAKEDISYSKQSGLVDVNEDVTQVKNHVDSNLKVQTEPHSKQALIQDDAYSEFQDAIAAANKGDNQIDFTYLTDYVDKYPDKEAVQKVKQLLENIPQQQKNTIVNLAQNQPQITNEIQSVELKRYSNNNLKSGKAEFAPLDIKTDVHGFDIQKTGDFLKLHTSIQELVKQKPAPNTNEAQYKPFTSYVSEKPEEQTKDYKATPLFDQSLSKPTHQPLSFIDKTDNVKKVPFENISNEITQNLATAVKEGKKEITLVLTPENLGELRLKVSSDKNGVTAHIITDSLRVQDEINRQSIDLRDNLIGQGFKVNTIEVQYKGKSDGSDLFSGFNQQSRQQSGQHTKQQKQEQHFSRYIQSTDSKTAINAMLKSMTEDLGLDYLV